MKLVTGDLSPYSAKVRMQLYAMGVQDVDFDLPASFFMGKLSEYSPIGRIPVLEVDEGIIPESEVIAEYLDECYLDQSLLGEHTVDTIAGSIGVTNCRHLPDEQYFHGITTDRP